MSRRCEWSSIGVFTGNKVSHSNIKTRTRWIPNLKKKKYQVAELGQAVTLTLSARAIRTIDKLGGLSAALFETREEKLSPRLQKMKRDIYKQRVALSKPGKKTAASAKTK
jgi:large subunit ribosomal protein L28